MNIPRKLPTIELNMAAVSLPCAARVNITALETGGGIQATVMNLKGTAQRYQNQM